MRGVQGSVVAHKAVQLDPKQTASRATMGRQTSSWKLRLSDASQLLGLLFPIIRGNKSARGSRFAHYVPDMLLNVLFVLK